MQSANHCKLLFADGEKTLEVSTAFIQQCNTLSMFEIMTLVSDDCSDPIQLPGLEFDRHAPLLGVVSQLDMRALNSPDETSIEKIFDLKLGSMRTSDLMDLLVAADYLNHARALSSCARIVAQRLKGKSRKEMLDILCMDELPDHIQIENNLNWLIPKDKVPML